MVAVADTASVIHVLACRMLHLLWMYSLAGLLSVALGGRAGSITTSGLHIVAAKHSLWYHHQVDGGPNESALWRQCAMWFCL